MHPKFHCVCLFVNNFVLSQWWGSAEAEMVRTVTRQHVTQPVVYLCSCSLLPPLHRHVSLYCGKWEYKSVFFVLICGGCNPIISGFFLIVPASSQLWISRCFSIFFITGYSGGKPPAYRLTKIAIQESAFPFLAYTFPFPAIKYTSKFFVMWYTWTFPFSSRCLDWLVLENNTRTMDSQCTTQDR